MDNSESYVILAKSLNGQGKPDEALNKLEIALKIQPSNLSAIDEYMKGLAQKSRYSDLTNFLELQLQEGRVTDKILINLASAKMQLGRSAEALDHLNQCKYQDGHDWHVHNLKIKIDLKLLDEARVHGREILIIKDKVSALITPDQDVALRCRSWPVSPCPFDVSSPHRNIVCFSLWGNEKKYTHTAVLNAKLVPTVYSGWKARFYVDASVPLEIIEAIINYGAQVIMMEEDSRTYLKLFWRFLAASDVNLDYFICRDCDSIVNYREKAAVDEWLSSGKLFHIMRDHPEHAELIMAGMWGGAAGILPDLANQAVNYYETHETKWRWVDQDFLRDHVWPLIKNVSLTHDSQYLFGSNALPFPTGSELPIGEHVGAYMPVDWIIKGKV
jgi:tetratricopeptide (TPR) repeat protein